MFLKKVNTGHERGGTSSQPSGVGIKRGPIRSFSIREGTNIPPKGIDSYMFPSKQKSIKNMFFAEGAKKVGKAISKFFLFNGIPFNAADSGPYYQSMIDTIAKAGPGIKGQQDTKLAMHIWRRRCKSLRYI